MSATPAVDRGDERPLVLNVDDTEGARYAKSRLLAEHGFRVLEASNGRDALEIADRQRPDVILLDVGLPGMDGIEVCRRLKIAPATRGIPVVQTSASFVQDSDRVRALEGGADTYLIAPTDPRVLVATVNAMLRMRRAEMALRVSENRFRIMADAAPVLIWIADTDGLTTWLNRRWLEFTGTTADADPDVSRWSAVHPDDVAACKERIADAFTNRAELRIEYRIRHRDGDYHWVLDQGAPLYDGESFTGFVGSCVDITEQRSAEEQRRQLFDAEHRARNESERLNRVKDEFLATLSHELRTPLNAIMGWSQVLLAGRSTAAETTEAIQRIERNARSQARIIEDLLEMSRIVSGKMRLSLRPVDVTTVARNALGAVAPAAAERGVDIAFTVVGGPYRIQADADRLEQVLWNLLNNAIKFSRQDGRVMLTMRGEGDHVVCEVVDHGIGIEPMFLPHVFERFRQADPTSTRVHGGLGLGLAIVKNLVELHGGSVSASSDGAGKGATFRIRLPITTAQLEEKSPKSGRAPGARDARTGLRGAHILVVDDDEDARDLLRRIFEAEGARVTLADSALTGIEAYRSHEPDLIVSDIGMPGLDGYDLIRRIRELEPVGSAPIPAVALTAFARQEDREQALRAGYQIHLVKPILAERLLEASATMLEQGVR